MQIAILKWNILGGSETWIVIVFRNGVFMCHKELGKDKD